MLKIFLCKTKTKQTEKKKKATTFFLLYGGLVIEPIFSNKMPLNENSKLYIVYFNINLWKDM